MRGAQDAGGTGCKRGGIIPADAGSTQWSDSIVLDARDHPRGCGEHNQDCLTVQY